MPIVTYHVDAFTNTLFSGSGATVCILKHWLSKEIMQKIATENNQPMTTFLLPQEQSYQVRWFGAVSEAVFCGHGTLAAAYVILHHIDPHAQKVTFDTPAGTFTVSKDKDYLVMDFPLISAIPVSTTATTQKIFQGIDYTLFKGKYDYMAVLPNEAAVRAFVPSYDLMRELDARMLIVTARGDRSDCASRGFAIPEQFEDPVTGSMHCMLAPYWAQQLNKTKLVAEQVTQRHGTLYCEIKGDRVFISGQAVLYSRGEINFDL